MAGPQGSFSLYLILKTPMLCLLDQLPGAGAALPSLWVLFLPGGYRELDGKPDCSAGSGCWSSSHPEGSHCAPGRAGHWGWKDDPEGRPCVQGELGTGAPRDTCTGRASTATATTPGLPLCGQGERPPRTHTQPAAARTPSPPRPEPPGTRRTHSEDSISIDMAQASRDKTLGTFRPSREPHRRHLRRPSRHFRSPADGCLRGGASGWAWRMRRAWPPGGPRPASAYQLPGLGGNRCLTGCTPES